MKNKGKKFNKNTLMLFFGVAIMLVFCIFAIFPKQIARYDLDQMFEPFLGCSRTHILGTNNIGRDIFTEMVFATQSTLVIGLLSAVIALGIGVTVGLLAGYVGGVARSVISGFIDFFLLIPLLPLAIVLASYLGAGQQNIILTIAILGWCGTARAVKGKTSALKNLPFVTALRNLGVGRGRILFGHILPNLREVILAKYIMSVASCILLEATLSFLGLGNVNNLTWGGMVNLAYKHGGLSMGAYNWFLAPGICIMLLVLAFYFINFYLENASKAVLQKGFL